MDKNEKAPQKPGPEPLMERLRKAQDLADAIGPLRSEIDRKTISEWVYEDVPNGKSNDREKGPCPFVA